MREIVQTFGLTSKIRKNVHKAFGLAWNKYNKTRNAKLRYYNTVIKLEALFLIATVIITGRSHIIDNEKQENF